MISQRHHMAPEQAAYEIPEIWNEEWFSNIDHERTRLFAKNVPEKVQSLLDVGCGNGMFLHQLSSVRDVSHMRLCGVDRSYTALKHVRTEKYLSSIDCLPFKDNEFDIVTALEVIEHLPSTIYREALKEISRVARNYLLIGVPFNEDIRNSLIECPNCGCRFNVDYHLRSFSERYLANLFDEYDFLCKKIFFFHPKKIMRPFINKVYILIRALRRLYRNRDINRYPGYALCPACLYENRKNLELPNKSFTSDKKKLGSLILDTVGAIIYTQSYHWIGAIYKANNNE